MTKAEEDYFQKYLERLRKAARCEPSRFGEVVKVEIQDLRGLLQSRDDMLVALKAMVKVDAEDGADDEYLRYARAAIAKAEGR